MYISIANVLPEGSTMKNELKGMNCPLNVPTSSIRIHKTSIEIRFSDHVPQPNNLTNQNGQVPKNTQV